MLLTLPSSYLFAKRFALPTPATSLWGGLLGGLLFGLRAALNRVCTFSTLQRLVE